MLVSSIASISETADVDTKEEGYVNSRIREVAAAPLGQVARGALHTCAESPSSPQPHAASHADSRRGFCVVPAVHGVDTLVTIVNAVAEAVELGYAPSLRSLLRRSEASSSTIPDLVAALKASTGLVNKAKTLL